MTYKETSWISVFPVKWWYAVGYLPCKRLRWVVQVFHLFNSILLKKKSPMTWVEILMARCLSPDGGTGDSPHQKCDSGDRRRRQRCGHDPKGARWRRDLRLRGNAGGLCVRLLHRPGKSETTRNLANTLCNANMVMPLSCFAVPVPPEAVASPRRVELQSNVQINIV